MSHTMGERTVASCVVFGPEGPLKSDYRRFNIEGLDAWRRLRARCAQALSNDAMRASRRARRRCRTCC